MGPHIDNGLFKVAALSKHLPFLFDEKGDYLGHREKLYGNSQLQKEFWEWSRGLPVMLRHTIGRCGISPTKVYKLQFTSLYVIVVGFRGPLRCDVLVPTEYNPVPVMQIVMNVPPTALLETEPPTDMRSFDGDPDFEELKSDLVDQVDVVKRLRGLDRLQTILKSACPDLSDNMKTKLDDLVKSLVEKATQSSSSVTDYLEKANKLALKLGRSIYDPGEPKDRNLVPYSSGLAYPIHFRNHLPMADFEEWFREASKGQPPTSEGQAAVFSKFCYVVKLLGDTEDVDGPAPRKK